MTRQRHAVLEPVLGELGFNAREIGTVVKATGATTTRAYGYTYSDLTQQFLPALVLAAFPDRPVAHELVEDVLRQTAPTPPFTSQIA